MLNVLFITADQWRGDSLGYAGHTRIRTPNVDAFAAESTAFLNHYSNAAPCSPARACLYNGVYQMTNRVVQNGAPLAHRFDNIALAARRTGYGPTLFGYTDQAADPTIFPPGDPRLKTYEGVLPGMDVRVRLPEDEKPWLSWLKPQGIDYSDKVEAHMPVHDRGMVTDSPPVYAANQTQTAFLADEFIRWMGEQDGPWFGHLSFLRPHPPFIVPAPYNTMYDPADVGDFRRMPTPAEESAIHPLLAFAHMATPASHFAPGMSKRVAELTEEEFRQIKATYWGMISEVDAQLGRVFAAVRAAGAWDNTLIIFTSDHAELMGDHYLLGKGGFHDESQHVPLVIRDPRRPGNGRKVTAFTEAVDIYPTLLEAMGVAPNHVGDGTSLRPWLEGETPQNWRDAVHWEFDWRDIATQLPEQAMGLDSVSLNMVAIRTSKWKYVHFAALPPLLFDMENDPENLRNLAEDLAHLPVRLMMAEKLLSWRARHLEQTLALKTLTPSGVVSREISR